MEISIKQALLNGIKAHKPGKLAEARAVLYHESYT